MWRHLFHSDVALGPVQLSGILAGPCSPLTAAVELQRLREKGAAASCRFVSSRLNFKPLPHACFPVRGFRLGLAEPTGMKLAAHRLDLRSPVSLYGSSVQNKVFWMYKKKKRTHRKAERVIERVYWSPHRPVGSVGRLHVAPPGMVECVPAFRWAELHSWILEEGWF